MWSARMAETGAVNNQPVVSPAVGASIPPNKLSARALGDSLPAGTWLRLPFFFLVSGDQLNCTILP